MKKWETAREAQKLKESGKNNTEIAEDGKIHDDYRIDYIRKHVQALKEALKDGVEVMGYTYWEPIDIVSAGTGEMKKRYGFGNKSILVLSGK